MKQLLFTLLLLVGTLGVSNAQSPNYVDFEWDILKLGYAFPAGEAVTAGALLGTEVRLNLMDQLSVGVRWEIALFGDEFEEGVEVGAAGSAIVTGDYYLKTDSAYRLFGGLGFGRFTSGSVTLGDGTEVDGASSVGLVPRVGYEFNHLRLMAEYNYLFAEGASNYFGLSAALTLWGGYKG